MRVVLADEVHRDVGVEEDQLPSSR
jgi:hypothetical protein